MFGPLRQGAYDPGTLIIEHMSMSRASRWLAGEDLLKSSPLGSVGGDTALISGTGVARAAKGRKNAARTKFCMLSVYYVNYSCKRGIEGGDLDLKIDGSE